MLIESMGTSLIVGKIRKGKVKNIGNIHIKGWYLFIIGFILEFTSVFLKAKNVDFAVKILDNYFIYIHCISYILIFIGLVLNFDKKSMIIIFIGTMLNFAAIMSNGGQMPVSKAGMINAGLPEQAMMLENKQIITHTLIDDTTRLSILGDTIPLSKPYPLPKMISIGDIFLGLGVFFLIQEAMITDRRFKSRGKMIQFGYRSNIKR